jgi:hypothetical protein
MSSIILTAIPNDNPISIEAFLKECSNIFNITGNIDEIALEIARTVKDELLDYKTLIEYKVRTDYSGSWGVPNPTTITTITINKWDDGFLKDMVKAKTSSEKARKKEQDKRDKNHNYQFQRSSTYTVSYKTTTLRKLLKEFPNREKGYHGTLSSSYYEYKIQKI